MITFLLTSLEKPRSQPHRPTLDEIDKVDRVTVKRDEPQLVPVVEPPQHEASLGVEEIDAFAAEEAARLELGPEAARQHIHQRQREHHAATKQRIVEDLRTTVRADAEDSFSPNETEYASRLNQSLTELFSVEPDESGVSPLEREFEAVLTIESIEEPAEREAARRKYVAGLAARLNARPRDVQAIYQRLTEQPEIYRALKQQRQVLLLIEHEPERYDEFIKLTNTGDDKAIDTFFDSIENDELREQLQTLSRDERAITQFIERRRVERLEQSRAKFGEVIGQYDELSEDQQVLLGRIAETAEPEFLALVREASLAGDADGLSGTVLRRPLRIHDDGRAFLGLAEILQFDGSGIRRAAAVDVARLRHCEVFNELAENTTGRLLEPFFQLDPVESLPVRSDLNRVAHVLDALGLKTGVADGWLILREFQLLNEQSQPNSPGIRRLIRQIQKLSHRNENLDNLAPSVMRRILAFWDAEGTDPRNSTILSANDVAALAETT